MKVHEQYKIFQKGKIKEFQKYKISKNMNTKTK